MILLVFSLYWVSWLVENKRCELGSLFPQQCGEEGRQRVQVLAAVWVVRVQVPLSINWVLHVLWHHYRYSIMGK